MATTKTKKTTKAAAAVTSAACPGCKGTGSVPPVRLPRGGVRGQLAICLTCMGSGEATTDTTKESSR